MDVSLISNDELVGRLNQLTGTEREVTLNVLYCLTEMESRSLYLELGYSSLFKYCTSRLSYSEGSAFRRIAAARCLKECPELGELFLDGKVSLCTMAAARDQLTKRELPVSLIAGRSKREVELLVAKQRAVKPRERVKPVAVTAPALPLFEAKAPPEIERYTLTFSVTKEVYQQVEEARSKLSHSLGKDLSLEGVFGKLLQGYLRQPKTRVTKPKKPNTHTRFIPRAERQEVLTRDNHRCSYTAADGTRCNETHYLEFDHIQPYALGGKTDASNLRLLCRAHNQLHARNCFGSTFIQQRVALSPVKVE